MLAFYLGLPRQSEILLIVFLGICFLSLDFSLFHLKSNMDAIWKLELHKAKYLEKVAKYVISAVVIARTFTLHAFLAAYIILLWPAIFEEKPNLMLPWLLLGILRCLLLNLLTFVLGTFICHKEKGLSSICLEYILAQAIEHGPSVYAWFCVLSFYREIGAECGSQDSSAESLCCKVAVSKHSQSFNRICKTRSLSDLNLDYSQSSQVRDLPASMEVLRDELRDLFARRTRILKESSKSFDSLIDANLRKRTSGSISGTKLSIMQRSMKALKISVQDVQKARELQGQFHEALKAVSVSDVHRMENALDSKSFYVTQGKLYKGIKSHMPKSHSQADDGRCEETCLCYIKKQLQLKQSDQTLLESEIANITLNDLEKEKPFGQKSDSNDLNGHRMGVGLGFNPNILMQKFALENNACQVALLRRNFLEKSREQLKKLMIFNLLGFYNK